MSVILRVQLLFCINQQRNYSLLSSQNTSIIIRVVKNIYYKIIIQCSYTHTHARAHTFTYTHEGVSKSFRTESIMKYMLTFGITD